MSGDGSIAVVIPLYNKGPHIGRALGSVLAQSVAPDEIIIIDDASTDDGVAQASRFADPRIRLLRRDRPGPGGYAARNEGVQAAKSEWIAFLDADDSWTPGAVEEVSRLIALADAGVSCIFTAYAQDFGDRTVSTPGFEDLAPEGARRLSLSDFLDAWLKVGRSPMWTSAVVARRSALIEAGLFPAGKCDRGGDKDTWLRLMTVGDALCSAVETATYHRDSVNMVTKTTSANQRPYLCGTLEALLPDSEPALAERIRQLINWEMICHAREAWRARARISPLVFKGFIVRQNPLGFVLLSGAARAPQWALEASYRVKSAAAWLKRRGKAARA